MKTKAIVILALFWAGAVFAGTNDITALLQKGLFEEEANHNLEAALRQYQAAVDGFDQDRQLAATAVFRLGECYRKLGKTNEATAQYERVVRDFPDQPALVNLSREYLAGKTTTIAVRGAPPAPGATAAEDEEVRKIQEMIRNSPDLINAPVGGISDTPLQSSVRNGNVSAAALLLDNGVDPNSTGATGFTPLGMAADNGNKAMIELLLAKGADVNAGDRNNNDKRTALDHAIGMGFKSIVEVLIAHKATVNPPDGEWTPLHRACSSGFTAVASLLVASGAKVDARNPSGETPLFAAVRGDQPSTVRFLISAKADVNATNSTGQTPIFMAAKKTQVDVAQLLLEAGADPNRRDKSGQTPLLNAGRDNQAEIAKLLLQHQADVNAATPDGMTALLYAVGRSGDLALVKNLLDGGANTQAVKKGESIQLYSVSAPYYRTVYPGEYPLNIAMSHGRADLVQALLAAHGDPNASFSCHLDNGSYFDGAPVFWVFQCADQSRLMELLLEAGADPNRRDKSGQTPLLIATRDNQTEIVKLLLQHKADVNVADSDGVTPLLYAVRRPDVDISLVEKLLTAGANTQATCTAPNEMPLLYPGMPSRPGIPMMQPINRSIYPGMFPLNSAISADRNDVMEALLAAHADPNAYSHVHVSGEIDFDGTSLLWTVVRGPNPAEQLKILLEHGANPDLTDADGTTPLCRAVMKGDMDSIRVLLDHHADPNKTDDRDLPPLAYVSGRGQEAIRAALLKAGANEDYQRLARIYVAQKGTGSLGTAVFYRGTNTVNHFTLLEAFSAACRRNGGPLSPLSPPVGFADLAHVIINRLKPGGGKEEIAVNLEEILDAGDCAKNLPLEWGDVVQIPQKDHLINESEPALPDRYAENLIKCQERHVEIVVKGQTTKLTLQPEFARAGMQAPQIPGLETVRQPTTEGSSGKVLYTFLLNDAIREANVLLLSSDLSRVTVMRHGQELHYDLSDIENNDRGGRHGGGGGGGGGGGFGGRFGDAGQDGANDLWLQDGDVIQIPERDPNAPVAK